MIKCYLGIDIGSVFTKAVVIDSDKNIIANCYLSTGGNPTEAVKKVICELKFQMNLDRYSVVSVGITGLSRKLIGSVLKASVIKNEVVANVVGTTSIVPNAKTIFEIGGQDSKIILLENSVVVDYTMNTFGSSGIGNFLNLQANRLGISIEEFGNFALNSSNPLDVTFRCFVLPESDLFYTNKFGYKKEDIIAGICRAVVNNYFNNVVKDKKIKFPIVFQGGVSKNKGIKKAFEDVIGEEIIVVNNSHLMGALGVAILAKNSNKEIDFSFDIEDICSGNEVIKSYSIYNNC